MARKASDKTRTSGGSDPRRYAWKRDLADQSLTEKLGQKVREHREKRELSLIAASDLTGVPAATLSRIETNKMSPTFTTLVKLMMGLRLSWADLIGDAVEGGDGEISIAMPSTGELTEVPGYAYFAPHLASSLNDRMLPLIFEVRAADLDGAGGLRGHKGYEFCYVLSGTVIMHIEGREPAELPAGASILFNCEIPHAYVAKTRSRPRVLNVTVVDPTAAGDLIPFDARFPKFQGAAS